MVRDSADVDVEVKWIDAFPFERAGQADAAGEIGLKVRLEEILADETDHAEEIVRLLGGRGGD